MRMGQWWNGTDKGKLKYFEKKFINCGGQMHEIVWYGIERGKLKYCGKHIVQLLWLMVE
jgi:hypothetical protein